MEDYMEDLKDVVEEPNQINPSEEINSEEEIKKQKKQQQRSNTKK